MGLRGLPLNPQPQDIGSGIPGEPELSMQDVMGEPTMSQPQMPQGSMADVMGPQFGIPPSFASQPQLRPPQPPMGGMDTGGGFNPEREADRMLAEMSQNDDPRLAEEAERSIAAEEIENTPDPFGDIDPLEGMETAKTYEGIQADIFTQLIAGLPKTDMGRLDALRKKFGKDNVEFDGDMYVISTPNGKRFVGDKGFDLADTVAAQSGNIIEGLIGATVSTGGTLALARMGLSGGVPGFVGSMAAGAVGAAAGSLGRDLLVKDFMNIEEAEVQSSKNDALWAAGIDATMFMGMSAVRGVGNSIWKAYLQTAGKRAERAGIYRLAVDQAHSKLKLAEITRADGLMTVSPYKTGAAVEDAMDVAENYLETRMEFHAVKAAEISARTGQKFVPESTMRKLREHIGDAAMEDKHGKLVLNPRNVLQEMDLVEEAGEEAAAVNGSIRMKQAFWSGHKSGGAELSAMVEKYNAILGGVKAGGAAIEDIEQIRKFFASKRNFDQNNDIGDSLRAKYGELYRAAANDKAVAMRTLLKGTPSEKLFEKDLLNYATKIDTIGDVKSIFRRYGPMKSALDAIITPQNAEPLQKVVRIVGKNSQEFKNIQAYWISERINEAISTSKPFFDGDAFLEAISERKWGKEVMETLFPDKKVLQEFKLIAVQAQKLQVGDLWKDKIGQLEQVVSGLTLGFAFPSIGVRNMWRFASKKPAIAYYLSQEGLLNMATQGKFSGTAEQVRQGIDTFEAMVNASREVKSPFKPLKKGAKAVGTVLVPVSRKAFQAAFRGEAVDYEQLNLDKANLPPEGPGIDEMANGEGPVYVDEGEGE